MPKSLTEQLLGRCRHFTGIMNDECEVGVKYADVRDRRPNVQGYAFPCLRQNDNCPKASFKTPEEVEAEEREIRQGIGEMATARAAIVKATGGQRGVHGDIVCPCCNGGRLLYSVASSNGHIHARCSTDGCVCWME